MQNCTHLLSFDICIHPRNHYPNQDNRSIYLLPKVSLCPFIDSFTSTSSLQATAICYLSLWFEFPTVLYKQNHSVCTLFVWFLSLHVIILRFTYVVEQINSSLLFFLLLSSIPLHEHTTIYLSVDGHLSCLVVSSFWLLSCCEHLYKSFYVDTCFHASQVFTPKVQCTEVHPIVECLGLRLGLCITF